MKRAAAAKRIMEESSGNVFADLGLHHPEQELLKAKLTLQIYGLIKQQHPTLRTSRKVGAPGLTVDMLEHSSHKNMDNALLVAGDEDFTPLVESVVRLGIWVEVYYDPRSAAEELYAAADRGIPMKF